MGNNLSNKYGQKLLDSAKKSTTDVIKTASKKTNQETADATGDLIVNKIAEKRSCTQKILLKNYKMTKQKYKKKIYISRRKTTSYWWIKVSITI